MAQLCCLPHPTRCFPQAAKSERTGAQLWFLFTLLTLNEGTDIEKIEEEIQFKSGGSVFHGRYSLLSTIIVLPFCATLSSIDPAERVSIRFSNFFYLFFFSFFFFFNFGLAGRIAAITQVKRKA